MKLAGFLNSSQGVFFQIPVRMSPLSPSRLPRGIFEGEKLLRTGTWADGIGDTRVTAEKPAAYLPFRFTRYGQGEVDTRVCWRWLSGDTFFPKTQVEYSFPSPPELGRVGFVFPQPQRLPPSGLASNCSRTVGGGVTWRRWFLTRENRACG